MINFGLKVTYILLFMFVLPIFVRADSYFFNTDLFLGMENVDVRVLQKVLNEDPLTLIATEGLGSKGNETTYFGLKTQSAVIRFQEKYRKDILTPNGLLNGTGYVGPSTRTVLNALLKSKDAPKVSTVSDIETQKTTELNKIISVNALGQSEAIAGLLSESSIVVPSYLSSYFATSTVKTFNETYKTTDTNTDAKNYGAMYGWLNSTTTTEFLKGFNLTPDYFLGNNWQKYPHIFTAVPNEVSPGETVKISGINLDVDGLKLTLGSEEIPYKKVGVSTFDFVVPKGTGFGTFDVSFKKDGTRYQKNQISILVKKKDANPSFITSVVSVSGDAVPSITDTFIIKGGNFESENDIVTTFGVIPKASSASKTEIEFTFANAPLLAGIMKTLKNNDTNTSESMFNSNAGSMPVVFYIKNANGRSNNFGPINIKF